jgi:hypothetical protein
MLYRSKLSRTGLKAAIISTVMFLGAVSIPATSAPTNSSSSVAPLILSGRQSDRPAGTFSPGVAEIIKMLDAQVDATVLLAFIQNSAIPYDPDATELIALKAHSASTEILTAMLHHGDELRLRFARAATSANPAPAAPAYDYPPDAAYPPYSTAPYPDSGGVLYPTVYYGHGYGYRSPWLGRSSACNTSRPWYDYGRWWAKFDNGRHFANETPSTWATAASRVPQPPFSGFTVGGAHANALALHSAGGHASGGGSASRPASRSR